MLPYQVDLLAMSFMLLGAMFVGAAVSAFLFRNIYNWVFIIAAFLVAIAMIFGCLAAAETNNVLLILGSAGLFGAAIGASLGGFVLAVTDGHERGAEAVMVTLSILAVVTVVTGVIGLLSGFNFQGMGGVMFIILLVILGITFVGLFVRWNKVTEMVIGLGVSLFFAIYMIYDFNKAIHLYKEATWSAAMDIAMNLFLDMVNIFVRLLPIILDAMD